MTRTLIAGCGYLGGALGRRLVANGHEVWGVRRSAAPLPHGVRPLRGDVAAADRLIDGVGGLDVVVYAVSPDGPEDRAYRAAYVDGLARLTVAVRRASPNLQRLVFVSSTAVYGEREGAWVDEESAVQPDGQGARRLREGEEIAWNSACPATVVRCGGIYGAGRAKLVHRVRCGTEVCRRGPSRYLNLIHQEDCAGALAHILSLPRPARCYVAVDCEPAPRCEVLRWIARQLGVPPPPVVEESDPAARGRRGNKRCRNTRLVGSGYRFAYPTYREGLAQVMLQEAARR